MKMMKVIIRRGRTLFAVLSFIVLLSIPAFGASIYRDTMSETSFNVPEGWSEEPLSQERDFIKVKFSPDDGSAASMVFGSADIWSEMSNSDKAGLSREDYNISLFNKGDFADIYEVSTSDIISVKLGSVYYYKSDIISEQSISGVTFEVNQSIYSTIQNGYLIQFQYAYTGEDYCRNEFEESLKSVTIPHSVSYLTANPSTEIQTSDTSTKTQTSNTPSVENEPGFRMDFSALLLSVVVTVLVYSFPIILYRYAWVKRPIEKQRAKKITILYAIAAFMVMAIILGVSGNGAPGGAIILWSYINYAMLTSGKDKNIDSESSLVPNTVQAPNNTIAIEDNPEDNSANQETKNLGYAEEEDPSDAENAIGAQQHQATESDEEGSKTKYCRKCGASVFEGALFCNKCGTKIWVGDKNEMQKM